jgi:hypothetical protein
MHVILYSRRSSIAFSLFSFFVADLKLFTAMKHYERGNLSLGKAAVLAGKSEEDFMEALSEH